MSAHQQTMQKGKTQLSSLLAAQLNDLQHAAGQFIIRCVYRRDDRCKLSSSTACEVKLAHHQCDSQRATTQHMPVSICLSRSKHFVVLDDGKNETSTYHRHQQVQADIVTESCRCSHAEHKPVGSHENTQHRCDLQLAWCPTRKSVNIISQF